MTGNACISFYQSTSYELKLPLEVMPGLLPFRSRSKQCVKNIFIQFSSFLFSKQNKDKTVAFETEEILEESQGMCENNLNQRP